MSVAYYSKTPNTSRENVEKIYAFLGERPVTDGHIFHADGPLEGGSWWTFDIFDSEDNFTRYHEDRMQPAFKHVGVEGVKYHRLDVLWDSSQG